MQEYIKLATVTESRIEQVVINHEHLENLLNAYIEIGNVLDTVKKSVFYGKPIDRAAQNKRLSSSLSSIASILGEDFTEDAEPLKIDPRVFHSVVGIATEGTELVEAVFNSEFRNEQFDTVNLVEELFDVMWYVLIAHDATNQELDNTLNMGFAKLKLRFSDKFNAAGALNRDLVSERELLTSYVQKE